MPSPSKGPRLSTQQYYDIEAYFFRLALYTDSEEYAKMSFKSRRKIDDEINRVAVALDVMQIFRNKDASERAIVAWKDKLDHEDEMRRLLRFSTIAVAQRCLGIPTTKIAAVARKTPGRRTAEGYVFRFEDEYNHGEETIHDYNINRIKATVNGRNVE